MRVGDVIGMVALAIIMVIAVIIIGYMQPTAEGLKTNATSASFNSTIDTVFSHTWTGMTLGALGIIIAAAVGLLALVLNALGGTAQRGAF